ncbi:MAG: glycerophosphodiester phosphodiesterase family protein [Marmoricola sp.]
MKRPRPQVVAHRGSSATNAEHTLRAYIAALDEGAEGLGATSVRLSADGHLICFHDRDLRRTRWQQGNGLNDGSS